MKFEPVKHIAIVGTGMIGTSLAVLTTGYGYKTTMLAMNQELADKCQKQYDSFYADFVSRGLMTAEQAAICGRYLHFTTDYADLADVDIVFESVVEVLDVKHQVYQAVEANCPNVKAICSVSSALEVDKLAEGMTKYKDRIIVTHPFNPVYMVPYFELAKGSDTADGVVEFAKSLLEALGRKPVVLKRSAPGFIGNRLQFALWREALYIVESGIADPKDVDTCLMYSFCPRYTSIGIFEHFDNGGLDLNINVCNTVFPDLSDAKSAPKSITDRIAAGKLGAKTGEGFYDWKGVDLNAFRERVNEPYWHFIDWDMPKE